MTAILVERIVSTREIGTIFVGRTRNGARLHVKAAITAMLGRPEIGELWSVDGTLIESRWGHQITATRAVRILPSGKLIINYLSHCVSGIGHARAQRLWEHFRDRLPEALDVGDIDAIASVMDPARPVLGPRLAAALVAAWKSMASEARLVEWLAAVDVTDLRLVRRIHILLGARAISNLHANPYCLVPFLDWRRTDELGRRLLAESGCMAPEAHEFRLVGAADAVIKDLIATGSTAVAPDAFRESLAIKLAVQTTAQLIDKACTIAVARKAVIPSLDGDWRAPGCAAMENALVTRLRTMVMEPPSIALRDLLASVGFENINVSPDQAEAIRRSLSSGFAIINGGAGTGKTFVTRAICDLWERAGGTLLLATISGKAALRLSRSTRRLARTIFRTLRELDDRQNFETLLLETTSEAGRSDLAMKMRGLASLTTNTLVIIDEASMVDLSSLSGVVRRMPTGARLLLVGDECQLPPVSFGLTFHRFTQDPAITATLTTVHRQADHSSIPSAATSIRRRELPFLRSPAGALYDGAAMEQACGREAIADRLVELHSELSADSDIMIVTPTNEGSCGVLDLNRRLHERYVARTGLQVLRGSLGNLFSPGEPVLHLTNDYRRGLFNGSIGKVKRISRLEQSLIAIFDGEEHFFASDGLVNLALGYALTAHRAQGSEADHVFVAMPQSRLLDPSWLYTSITRARRSVVLVGEMQTMAEALKRPFADAHRRVGLKWK